MKERILHTNDNVFIQVFNVSAKLLIGSAVLGMLHDTAFKRAISPKHIVVGAIGVVLGMIPIRYEKKNGEIAIPLKT